MEIVNVTFTQWEKWNPRKDIKNPTWFAMSNRITEDDEIQSLTDAEFRAFIHMFCIASQKNSPTAAVNLEKAERITGIKRSVFQKTIEKLIAVGICTASNGSRTQSDGSCTLHYTTRQDTTEQNNTEFCTDVILTSAPKASARQTFKINSTEELKATFTENAKEAWIKLYSAEYVEREYDKAFVWLEANPKKNQKTKRGWQMFMAGWLDRGWARHSSQQTASPVKALPDRFTSLADRLILATKQFPPGDEGIGAFVGNDWEWVSRSRLVPTIRSMRPDDNWARKQLVEDLRSAYGRFESVSQKSG